MRFLLLLIAVPLLCSSCDYIGGGVAGAGYDPIWKRKAAENYRGFRDSSIQLTRKSESLPGVVQTFKRMLDKFPSHTLVAQNSSNQFGDLQIDFRDQHLTVQRSGQILFEERLPSVFYMHDLQVGRFQAQGRDLLLFVTKSRATTGLYFVGLYTSSGQRLLTTTLSTGELWDCELAPEGVSFVCPSQRLVVSSSTIRGSDRATPVAPLKR
jgi:hypothetical protein